MKSLHPKVCGVAIVTLSAAGLSVLPAASGAPTTGYCSPPVSFTGATITWTGLAPAPDSDDWDNAQNWSPATVPDAAGTSGTYQNQYVCIGLNKGGGAATVDIKTLSHHIAGIDIADGARLTVEPKLGLYLGAVAATSAVPSYLRAGSQLELLGGILGGDSPLDVAGTFRWSGALVKGHKTIATQAGDPDAGGLTTVDTGGKLLVEGKGFGGVELGDQRVIDNSGELAISNDGYLAMDDGTKLIDEAGSTLKIEGVGGIYQGTSIAKLPVAKVMQSGAVAKSGDGKIAVGVPVSFPVKPKVTVSAGQLFFQSSSAPKASVGRASAYGVGTCASEPLKFCRGVGATSADPQSATIATSSESGAPKSQRLAITLKSAPKKVGGHAVIGKAVEVTAPTAKTSHASRLIFIYDNSLHGVNSKTKAIVYRGHSKAKRVPMCKVDPVSTKNPSCLLSAKVASSGSKPTSGDLTITIVTEAADSRWVTV